MCVILSIPGQLDSRKINNNNNIYYSKFIITTLITMSKRLKKETARIEANENKQLKASKRNKLLDNDAFTKESSITAGVEVIYADSPTTPSKIVHQKVVLTFCNEGKY